MATKITSLRHLMAEAGNGARFVVRQGLWKSGAKWIAFNRTTNMFRVHDLGNGSKVALHSVQIMDSRWTNVGLALGKGTLFKDG